MAKYRGGKLKKRNGVVVPSIITAIVAAALGISGFLFGHKMLKNADTSDFINHNNKDNTSQSQIGEREHLATMDQLNSYLGENYNAEIPPDNTYDNSENTYDNSEETFYEPLQKEHMMSLDDLNGFRDAQGITETGDGFQESIEDQNQYSNNGIQQQAMLSEDQIKRDEDQPTYDNGVVAVEENFVPAHITEEITTAIEENIDEPVETPEALATPHYNTSDFTAHEQNVINTSRIDMSKGQSVSINTSIPAEYKEMADKFISIIENNKQNSDGVYEHFVTGAECSKFGGFKQWFENNYGYAIIISSQSVKGSSSDYVNLDVARMQHCNENMSPKDSQYSLLRLQNDLGPIIQKLGIVDGMHTDEVLWRIHNYIIDNFNYDSSKTNYFPGQMMRDGKGVCNAYTILFNTLARKCGIDSTMMVCCIGDHVEHVSSLVSIPDGDQNVYMVFDTTMSEFHGTKYMYGLSVNDAVKMYSERKGYNIYDIFYYTNEATYRGDYKNAISFEYDGRLFKSSTGTYTDGNEMLNDIMGNSNIRTM